MRNIRGLTLIELLISITLGMMLIFLSVSMLGQLTRIAKRDTAERQSHEDAQAIYRRLHGSLEAMYHPAQMRIEAHIGGDNAWGSDASLSPPRYTDDVVRLVWMSSVQHRNHHDMGFKAQLPYDLYWNMLEWTGDGAGGGSLKYATSSRRRSKQFGTGIEITTTAQVRRDRRRDLNDNDLRFMPDLSPAQYMTEEYYELGDRMDLRANLDALLPDSTEVSSFRLAWVDADGYSIEYDPAVGIMRRDSGGTVSSLLGVDYSTNSGGTHVHVIDGIFQDGRPHTPWAHGGSGSPVADSRSAYQQRPAVVKVAFTVIPSTNSGLELREEPSLNFSFIFLTSPKLPVL